MGIKANKFTVKLFVANTEVASSQDVALWQSVLGAINKLESGEATVLQLPTNTITDILAQSPDKSANANKVDVLSTALGLDVSVVKGACDPQTDEPFLHLDMHCWSDWKKNSPKRGVGVPAFSATLLALWFHYAELGIPAIKQSQKVLMNIGIEGKNPARAINNCEWLQMRQGKKFQLNPSGIEKAIEIAGAFCERRAPSFNK